jgi:hypothetical protein
LSPENGANHLSTCSEKTPGLLPADAEPSVHPEHHLSLGAAFDISTSKREGVLARQGVDRSSYPSLLIFVRDVLLM